MPDHPVAIHVLLVKSEGHGIHARGPAFLARVHLDGRLWFKDLRVTVAAVLQMHDHPVGHRFGGGGERTRWRYFHPFERLGFTGTEVISVGHEGFQRFWERLDRKSVV